MSRIGFGVGEGDDLIRGNDSVSVRFDALWVAVQRTRGDQPRRCLNLYGGLARSMVVPPEGPECLQVKARTALIARLTLQEPGVKLHHIMWWFSLRSSIYGAAHGGAGRVRCPRRTSRWRCPAPASEFP
jgi:hypothetical protein